MPQFFYEGNLEDKKEIIFSQKESHHLKVFRIKKNEKVKIFDSNSNQYYAIITGINNGLFTARLFEKILNEKKNIFISVYFPFIEKNALEDLIRKSCEAGADEFTPIITDYTQKYHIFDLKDKKNRIEEIILSAVKQSERPDIPILKETEKIDDIFKKYSVKNKDFIFFSKYNKDGFVNKSIKDIIKDTGNRISLFFGPEGGFSIRELELAEKFNCKFREYNYENANCRAMCLYGSKDFKK